ncbi:hypothetical protein BGZ73_002252 [Actinomortierella ambigua]|nr:hypothetical protein BGZ73_002252 [Actinomortierella ambigua]
MNVVKEIQRLNAREAALNINSISGSWHDQFKDSAHVFVGGLPYELTEGDVICVMSQFGEIASINLVRDRDTGKSKGYAFIKYVDQRSTVLAVDNMNGCQIKGRTLRVDHVQNYKVPKKLDEDGNEIEQDEDMLNNAMPKAIEQESASESESDESEVDDTGIDPDDPMREYLLKKLKKKAKKAKRKAEKESRAEKKAERRARREEKKARKEQGTKSNDIEGTGGVDAGNGKTDKTDKTDKVDKTDKTDETDKTDSRKMPEDQKEEGIISYKQGGPLEITAASSPLSFSSPPFAISASSITIFAPPLSLSFPVWQEVVWIYKKLWTIKKPRAPEAVDEQIAFTHPDGSNTK